MAIPRNYKAYLKKQSLRIQNRIDTGDYKDINAIKRELGQINYEIRRKDRKKIMDRSCEILDEYTGY
jgi:hypothetical protein